MAKSNFIIRGGADFSTIKKEIDITNRNLRGFETSVNSSSKGLIKSFAGIAKGAGISIAALGKLALIGMAIKMLYNFGKASLKVASDLEEIQNVTNVTFGSMSEDVNKFSKTLIGSHGIGELSSKKYASYMGAMLKSSGIHGEAVKNVSMDITKLTADMASFYNTNTDEMFDKIMSGMTGATMPLKKLGINMNIANLEAFALSQGITKSWQAMSQAEQTMLRYNYLVSVTADAQGDFARNSWTWANSTKILSEKWKEFMGIMGLFVQEIALPLVKALTWIVDGLIMMGNALSKIYTLITGRELVVQANNNMAESAFDAADGEDKLADGIGKAAKAAKKALAPFDELNILQNNMKDSTGSGGGLSGLGGGMTGDIGTTMVTTQVDDGIERSRERWEGFFGWIDDKWNGLKDTFAVPLMIPAPIFAMLPNPIYNPNWGLELPRIKVPGFSPIPNPVYNPVWNLVPPIVPVPIFPAINAKAYDLSLEGIKQRATQTRTALEKTQAELNKRLEEETSKVTKRIENGLSTAWGNIETNYNKHKSNVGAIATGISVVLVANINQGLSKVGTNINNTITTTQSNLQTWGRNTGSVAAETAKSFASNVAEGFRVTSQNVVTFANSSLTSLATWGSGVLSTSAETARGFASNMASGFSTTWDNFKTLMSSMGERVSGWWSENKGMVLKTAVVAGVIVGAGALALAMPAAIPYMASALGGLATIPALAKGGITDGPMLAMIGDNPGGKEVVSPLNDLLGMITTAVSSTSNNNSGDMTVIVKIGEDTITEKVVSNINRQSRISGKTIITV